jgi:hypothetical protein
MYVSKDVRIHGYFLKSEGVCEQKCLGNTGLDHYKDALCVKLLLTVRLPCITSTIFTTTLTRDKTLKMNTSPSPSITS